MPLSPLERTTRKNTCKTVKFKASKDSSLAAEKFCPRALFILFYSNFAFFGDFDADARTLAILAKGAWHRLHYPVKRWVAPIGMMRTQRIAAAAS